MCEILFIKYIVIQLNAVLVFSKRTFKLDEYSSRIALFFMLFLSVSSLHATTISGKISERNWTASSPLSWIDGIVAIGSSDRTILLKRSIVEGVNIATHTSDLYNIDKIEASGGGVYNGNTPICLNGSTGNMTLSGHTGTIIRWEKNFNSTGWTTISNTSTTYSENPSVAGTYLYRAVVSDSSGTAYSSAFTVVVNPALSITLGATPSIPQGSATFINLPYTANNGDQYTATFDSAAVSANITKTQTSNLSSSGNITLQLPYCLPIGTYSGTLYVESNWPKCTSVNYPFSIIINSTNVSSSVTPSSGITICSGTSTNISATSSGNTINWYTVSTGGTSIGSSNSGANFSVSPTTNTTYYAESIIAGGCSSSTRTATGLVSVGTIISSGSASSTQTLCLGTTMTNITHSTTGATGISNNGVSGANSLPAGVSASWSNNVITISGKPTVSGIYNYSIPLTGGCNGTVNATGTITVNPTTADAGPDQVGASTSFVLAASGTGVWSIVSGPSTLLSQFSSTTNPTATFSPAVAGSYELQWKVSNSCGTYTDQVVVANCVSNLISNGDFTNTDKGFNKAANWAGIPDFNNVNNNKVETYPETTYFSTGNTGSFTAELDKEASLMQTVSVIPNVSYTVSFRYARRPGGSTPTTVAVNIKVTGGSSDILSPTLTTTSTTPQIGTFTFTPTASSIGIEFYNSLHGGSTLGTIIDDIILIPSSQVAAYATTSPKGVFNTLTSCAGIAVQLGVDNVPSTGVTYSWTGSTGAVFSPSANSSNPTVTFTGSGIKEVVVTATTAVGCSGSPSTTYVNVKESPTITTAATPAVVTAVCQSSSSQTTTMAYTATTGTPTSYSIAWTGISNQNSTAFAFASGGGSVTGITVPAGTAAGTYLGIMTVTNDNSCTVTKNITLTVNPLPNNTGTSGFTGGSFCTGSQATVSLDALDSVGSPPYTLSYSNGSATFSQTITSNLSTAFNVGATSSTQYTLLSITDSKGCVNTNPDNKTANVTFRPDPTATISGTTAVCVGATNPSITFTNPQTAGITITYNINGGANQTIAVHASSTSTVSVATTTSGSFVYTLSSVVYSTSPSCTKTISGSATVTVNAVPATPAISSFSNINCTSSTGSVSLSNLPGSGTLSQAGTVANSYTISGTTMTVSNLAQGSYSFTVTNNGCTSASVSQAVSNDSSTTWNGSSWSNSDPTATKAAVVNGPLTVSSNLAACSLTVTSGIVTVNSGITLTITNAVSVSGSGQLIFENNSSLVQTTNVANTGNITYKRVSSLMKNFDFTYWSSPVAGQTALALSPNTLADKYFRFSGSANDWVFDNGTMAAGAGYIIRVPKPGTWANGEVVTDPYAQPVSFIGVPNNGNYSFAIGQDQYNLIGNPYPSAIDADSFISANSGVIYGALYFWTHNTKIKQSGSQYVYSSNDYATYNTTGGAATSLGTIPTGKIAAGQSFFVGNSAAGSFVFNNSMRVAGNNSQFFKFSKTAKTNAIERNRLWLNLTNEGGAFKQLLVGYITGATNNWDDLYDGASFDGNDYVDFYSVNKTDNLTIQGRALPFETTDFVPLGYRSTIAGSFEIAIDRTDGVLSSQEILLEDKKTGITHNLSKAKYTFTAIKGVENDRFVLKYGKTQLSIDKTEIVDQKVIVYQKNKIITIESTVMPIESIAVYDLLGRKIYSQDQVSSNKFIIDKLNSSEQLLIIKTTLEDKTVATEKVAF